MTPESTMTTNTMNTSARRLLRAGMPMLLLAAVAACGGKKDGGGAECKPLTVTIGGEPVTGLGHGLGYVEGGSNYSLFVFDHDKTTCEQMLAKSRTTPPNEQALSAGVSSFGPAIAYNANGKIGPGVEVSLAKKPAKPGDAMAMCVKATLPIKNGPHAGKELVAEGRLEGSFCGERK